MTAKNSLRSDPSPLYQISLHFKQKRLLKVQKYLIQDWLLSSVSQSLKRTNLDTFNRTYNRSEDW